jgi:putative peptidoglycan lipid II flippase
MVGTLASRATGLVRNSLLNQLFSREVTDAFVTAYKVPNLFRELLAEGALTNAFVPGYKALPKAEARRLAGALLGLLVLVNAALLIVAWLTAPLIVDLLISDNVDVALATRLTRIVFPFLTAISFSALAMGILNAEERFLAPAWAPVALNVVTATLMAIFPNQAVPLALAFVLGGAAQLAVQLPALARHGLLPDVRGLWHPALAGVLLLMVPSIFTTSGRQLLNVVASNVVTGIAPGAQTAFFNAELFLSLALGVFSISPALAFYSRLAADAVEAPEAFAGTLREGLTLIAFLTIPAGLILGLLAEPAVQVVFNYLSLVGRGLDGARLTLSIAAAAPLGLAIFPLGLNNLLIRTFYVRRRVRTPIAITLIFLTLHALLYWRLAPLYGIAGMSWATVIVAWSQAAALLVLVARRERLALAPFAGETVRMWLAGGAATLAAWGALQLIPWSASWFGFLGQALLGIALIGGLYLAFTLALRVEEPRRLVAALRRRA